MAERTFEGDRPETAPGVDEAVPERTHTGPLLIAGEDADFTRGALHVAELLARRDRVNAHVLGVVRPLTFPSTLLDEIDIATLEASRCQTHLNRVRQRVHQAAGLAAYFTVGAVTGNPASELARAASERNSELILVGLAEQGVPGRTASEDAALQVTRAAEVPVLAVPVDRSSLPKRAMVAMDFSPASQRAAQAVIPLLSKGSKLTLAYVVPDVDFAAFGKPGWATIHDHGVARLFERLAAALSIPGDISVETVLLRGEIVAALLDYARRADVDLIATGTQGETELERHRTGSVSTAVLRGAQCLVLIAPPPPTSS